MERRRSVDESGGGTEGEKANPAMAYVALDWMTALARSSRVIHAQSLEARRDQRLAQRSAVGLVRGSAWWEEERAR